MCLGNEAISDSRKSKITARPNDGEGTRARRADPSGFGGAGGVVRARTASTVQWLKTRLRCDGRNRWRQGEVYGDRAAGSDSD
jgi:hypothetical protein